MYLLTSDDPTAQLQQLSEHFGISYVPEAAMSRCCACNSAAFKRIDAAAATERNVPHRVLLVTQEFWACECCGKVFWMGPKSAAAMQMLEGLFQDSSLESSAGVSCK